MTAIGDLSPELRRAVEQIAEQTGEPVDAILSVVRAARASGSIAWGELVNSAPADVDELADLRQIAQRAASIAATIEDDPGRSGEYLAALDELEDEEVRLLESGIAPEAIEDALAQVEAPALERSRRSGKR